MIEPISVCELEAGSPRYQVPRFQAIAPMRSAKTIANPALEPDLQDQFDRQQRDDAVGDGAARGHDPRKLKTPDQTTARCAGSECV